MPEPSSSTPDPKAADALAARRFSPGTGAQLGLAALSGVVLAASQAHVLEPLGPRPVDQLGVMGLLAFFGLVPLLLAVRHASLKRMFWISTFALVVHFALTLYWLCIAMTVFGHIPLPVSIIALLLVCLIIAPIAAAGLTVGHLVSRHYGFPWWATVPVCLTAAETLRNYGPLGGFPWGNIGNSMATVPVILQLASLVGVHGLVLFVGLMNAALADVVLAHLERRKTPQRPIYVAGALLGFAIVYGGVRLSDPPIEGKTIRVAMLQGNIEQGIKNSSRQNARFILERYHALQAEAVEAGVDVVVWPEAAVPVGIRADEQDLARTSVLRREDVEAGRVPRAGIIGAVAVDDSVDPETGERRRRRYNTAFAVDGGEHGAMTVRGRFDKAHLVPFGEYVPWPFLEVVKRLVPGMSTPGEGFDPVTLDLGGGRRVTVGATICYEGVFPEITREFTREGAEVMFNVTNDAWYGVSSGPLQHFMMYALRAVESGRAVARAANTGFTGWVDARGRVHDLSNLYETTTVIADLPLSSETTVFATIGDVAGFVCIAFALVAWFIALLGPAFWVRERDRVEWVVGGAGISVMVAVLASHFVIAPPGIDEAASTRNLVLFIGGAVMGLGALSGRAWGRRAQVGAGAFAFVTCLIGPAYGAYGALVPGFVGLAVAVLAYRRREAYGREVFDLVDYRARASGELLTPESAEDE